MPRSDLPTAAECERIFHAVLAAGDIQGVDAALRLLAAQDPQRAQLLFDAMKVGLAIAEERDAQ